MYLKGSENLEDELIHSICLNCDITSQSLTKLDENIKKKPLF